MALGTIGRDSGDGRPAEEFRRLNADACDAARRVLFDENGLTTEVVHPRRIRNEHVRAALIAVAARELAGTEDRVDMSAISPTTRAAIESAINPIANFQF